MGLQLGAPPEVAERLEDICGRSGSGISRLGEDPALDQFMEAYCEMLMKYEEELSKPFKEAMIFLSCMETQFKSLSMSSPSSSLQDPRSAGQRILSLASLSISLSLPRFLLPLAPQSFSLI